MQTQSKSALTMDDLRAITPAVFASQPHPNVSNIYEFIPSEPIVRSLLDRGWTIRSAYQNQKDDVYASHRIVFDVPGAPRLYDVGDVHPTATLYNSHNRTRRVSFLIGLYRTICENQAQTSVMSHDFTKVHILGWGGLDLDAFMATAMRELAELPMAMQRMQERILAPTEVEDLGRKALSVKRYDDIKFAHLFNREQAAAITAPRRHEDDQRDLWTVFNVVQENSLYNRRGGLNEVSRNRNVNLGLWKLAQSYLN